MAAGRHALHVDDDPLVIRLVRGILTGAGYGVVSACNGSEALLSLLATPPSVILLDVDIGEESGYDLCNLMREAGATAPIAFLTANRTIEDLRKAREAGGDYFIVKPFTPAILLSGIEKAISMRGRAT
jgi:DNA-binding response OmpR family regulator